MRKQKTFSNFLFLLINKIHLSCLVVHSAVCVHGVCQVIRIYSQRTHWCTSKYFLLYVYVTTGCFSGVLDFCK